MLESLPSNWYAASCMRASPNKSCMSIMPACFGILQAKASGARVIATGSTKNHAYLTELGADVVVDYRSATWLEDIQAASPGLAYAFDTVGDASTNQCMQALAKAESSQITSCACYNSK